MDRSAVWGTVARVRTRVVNEIEIKYDAGHFGSWTEPRFISALEVKLPDPSPSSGQGSE